MSEDRRHAITIIAFVGSVFSPSYFRARRRLMRPDPNRFCGINIAIYRPRGGSWVFTEPPAHRVRRTMDAFEVAGTRMAWNGDSLEVEFDERTAVLGNPVRGRVRLHPHVRFDHPLALDVNARHHWWAVAPSARIEVELDQPSLSFSGSGYHDTNFGREPLERAFASWSWSRAELAQGTGVLYDVQPRTGVPTSRGLLFERGGRLGDLVAPEPGRLADTRWALRRPTRVDAGGDARVLRTLEDTPFYSRSLVETQLLGQRVPSVHESLDLDRFTNPVVQLMLPFRIRRGWRA